MNLAAILLLLLPTLVRPQTNAPSSSCDFVSLVKCFIEVLDDWAWTLYELKDNVVTITDSQCVHLRALDKCIKDEDKKHQCTHGEVLIVSNTVSDLLTHRKNSGSFLKSYYLLTYACSPEGQEMLTHHRECLRDESIGTMTLTAGTYLTEKYGDLKEEADGCDMLNQKLRDYNEVTKKICKGDAAMIMCNSLAQMFKGLYPSKLEKCTFNCTYAKEPSAEEENVPQTPEAPAAQHPGADADSTGRIQIASALAALLLGLLFRGL